MIDYQLLRSRRKTLSLSISRELLVVVRAPMRTPKYEIDRFVTSHIAWIERHTAAMKEQQERAARLSLNEAEIVALKNKARALLPVRVQYFSGVMGVTPTGITVTSAATRWGSCSGKNRLSFSYRLMLLPDEIIDYIVVHELAHIREKNHSGRFYAVVESYMPDYKERERLLKKLQKNLP